MNRIGLTSLPRRLVEHTGLAAPTYRRCFDFAVACRFPAELNGGRWTVDEADLDLIAAALGMKAPTVAAPPKLAPRKRITEQAAAN